jgi:hypothetical protein
MMWVAAERVFRSFGVSTGVTLEVPGALVVSL